MKKSLITCTALAIFCGIFLIQPVLSSAQQGGIAFYFYDDNGRLRSTIRSDGQVAIYQYDASGNIVSISRQPTPSSIASFSPATSLVNTNTQVTINGSGFGATVAENRVLFNGMQAQIVSANATQIVAIMPNGATTGPITVIMPTSAAISTSPFTVIEPSDDLTITGFTPTIGTTGTSVTISGTNFDTTPANNRVEFNGFVATVTSATATSLTAVVPAGATSGHIKVTAPAGSAVSQGDFFIPPSPTTVSQVEVTGRMAIGETKTVNILTDGKAGLIVFDGVAGDKVSVVINNSSLNGALSVRNPNGTLLGTTPTTTGNFIDVRTLPATGTYTIRIAAATNRRGPVTFTLHRVLPDVTATGTIGGPQITIPISVPGQNAVVTFNGTAGQAISIVVPVLSAQTSIQLLDPGLTVLASDSACCVGDVLFIELRLSVTGVYRLEINPGGSFTGNLLCQIYEVPPDVTGTITIDGPPVTVSLGVPGQKARLTFTGTAGQRVGLLSTFPGFELGVAIGIFAPDQTRLHDGSSLEKDFSDLLILPATGVYTITIDPGRQETGTITCSLITIPQDVSGTIAANGQPVSITTTTPGQNASLTFTGTGGQRFSIFVRFTSPAVEPLFTIGVRRNEVGIIGRTFIGEGFTEVFPGDVAGTYTITLNPSNNLTGTFTVALYEVPADISGSITIGGSPVVVPITAPGQNALLTFNGTAGQKISLKIFGASGFDGEVSIRRSNESGTFIDGTGFTEDQQEIALETLTLPTTSVYVMVINPRLNSTGTRTFTLYNVTTINAGAVTINGSPVTVDLTTSGQNGEVKDADLTFTVTGDSQFLTIEATNNITGCVTIDFVAEDGTTFGGIPYCNGAPIIFEPQEFVAGTYKIRINPVGTSAGSVTVRITSP